MELANWLQSEWQAIQAAPATYIGTVIIVWAVASLFTRARLGDEAAASKERSEYLQQRLSESEDDKSALLEKLATFGEDIVALKNDLASRPRIFSGSEKPKDARDGDIWMQH